MKNKKILTLALTATLFAACDSDFDEIPNVGDASKTNIEAFADNSVIGKIENYISKTRMRGASTRAVENVLQPYVYNGDTVLYTANYDGKGWDVFSTDERTPMVLISSPDGELDLDSDETPEAFKSFFYGVVDEVSQIKQIKNDSIERNPDWTFAGTIEDYKKLNASEATSRSSGDEPWIGHWELIYSYTIDETIAYETTNRTVTKWDQKPFLDRTDGNDQWNYYIPYASDTIQSAKYRGPAGCAAVGGAQYLYYLHFKNGKPSQTISRAVLKNATTNLYSFDSKNSTIWSDMGLTMFDSKSKILNSAKLIAYVGQKINTDYKKKSGNADFSKLVSFINKEGGYKYKVVDYDYNYLLNQLLNDNAVLMQAYSPKADNSGKIGHVFIVDYLKQKNTRFMGRYGWVGTLKSGESANYVDDEGHIVGYKIQKDEEGVRTDYTIKMNWGWDSGYYDDREFSIYSTDNWDVRGLSLKINRQMAKQ